MLDALPYAVVLLVAVLLADRQVRRLLAPRREVDPAELAEIREKLKKVTAAVNRLAMNDSFKIDV